MILLYNKIQDNNKTDIPESLSLSLFFKGFY